MIISVVAVICYKKGGVLHGVMFTCCDCLKKGRGGIRREGCVCPPPPCTDLCLLSVLFSAGSTVGPLPPNNPKRPGAGEVELGAGMYDHNIIIGSRRGKEREAHLLSQLHGDTTSSKLVSLLVWV